MNNLPSQIAPSQMAFAPSQLPSYTGGNFQRPSQFQPTNFNNNSSAIQQGIYPRSPSAALGDYPQASLNGFALDEETDEKGRWPRGGLIVGTLLLLVVLIGGGLGGYLLLKDQSQANTTTGAKSKPTVVTTPSVKPLFSDSFVNNNTGWDLTSNAGKFSVKVGGGSMVLEDDQNELLWEILPGKSFSDFRMDVDAALTRGDPNNGYGIYIRGGSSQDSDLGIYYRFELYGDGTYAVFKGTVDSSGTSQSTKVQGYLTNDAIASESHVNHITIVAKGPDMTFMVNGRSLYTYHDSSYKGGAMALFVSNLPKLTPGAQATFSHLAVFPLT